MDNRFKISKPRSIKRVSDADDLPDITERDINRLKLLWLPDVTQEEYPMRLLLKCIQQHLDMINPYFNALKDTQPTWYNGWRNLHKITQALSATLEVYKGMRFYAAPEDLTLAAAKANSNLHKADVEWELEKMQYSAEIDKRQKEIADIQANIKIISESNNFEVLNRYDVRKQPGPKAKPGCFSIFSSLFRRAPAGTQQQDDAKLKLLRDRLLLEYNDNLIFKTNSLREFSEVPPAKTDHYQYELDHVMAELAHHKAEFYRCQSRDVMLHCLRIYLIASRLFDQVYSQNDDKLAPYNHKTATLKVREDDYKIAGKAKALFQQLIEGMYSGFYEFYCMQPSRYEFSQYLQNFNQIHMKETQEMILNGNASEEVLQLIFTEYASSQLLQAKTMGP